MQCWADGYWFELSVLGLLLLNLCLALLGLRELRLANRWLSVVIACITRDDIL